jgi:hypothetical protein
MISISSIQKLKKFKALYLELKRELNAYDIMNNNHEGTVFLSEEEFFKHFQQFEIIDRSTEKFPHRFQATYDGIVFYCIGDAKDISMKFIMDEVMQEVAANA